MFNQLTAISILTASSLAISMDNQPIHKAIVVQEVTAIERPWQVSSLKDKNTVLVSSPNGSYIVDWKENKKTADIFTGKTCPETFTNPQKNAVVVKQWGQGIRGKTQLYDIETKNVMWEESYDTNPAFGPSHVFGASGKLYLVTMDGNAHCSNGKFYYSNDIQSDWKGIITSDSTEEEIFFVKTELVEKELKSSLCTITFVEGMFPLVSSVALPKNPDQYDLVNARLHSPISKLIALYCSSSAIWKLYDQTNKTTTDVQNCCSLTFHPNKPFLGMLTKGGFIEIRDIIKQTIVSKTNKSLGTPESGTGLVGQQLDFSQDGENLAVIVNYKCFVLSNLYPKND
jgi:hypothetical protein